MVKFYDTKRATVTPTEQIRRDYRNDPRLAMAQGLMRSGTDTSPVQSHWQGLNRALQAGLGAYFMKQGREDYEGKLAADKEAKSAASGALTRALMGGETQSPKQLPQGFVGPAPMVRQSGLQSGISELQGMEGNQYATDAAQQLAMQDLQFRRDRDAQRSEHARLRNEQIMRRREKLSDAETEFGRKKELHELSETAADRRAQAARQERLDFFQAGQDAEQQRYERSLADKKAGLEEQRQYESGLVSAENQKNYGVFVEGLTNVYDAMKQTETGPISGYLPNWSEGRQSLKQSVATMAPLLKSLFRQSGEGTFTDKDQEMLLNMIPNEYVDRNVAMKAIQDINSIVTQKLGMSNGGTKIVTPEDMGLTDSNTNNEFTIRRVK